MYASKYRKVALHTYKPIHYMPHYLQNTLKSKLPHHTLFDRHEITLYSIPSTLFNQSTKGLTPVNDIKRKAKAVSAKTQ